MFSLDSKPPIDLSSLNDPRIELAGRETIPLQDVTVLILGCGGVGSVAAWILAGAGIGSIVVADRETLSSDNVRRHLGTIEDIGREKTAIVAQFVADRFPNTAIHPRTFCFRHHRDRLRFEIERSTITLVAIDDESLKHMIDSIARERANPAIFLGVHGDGWGVETIVSDVNRNTPCYGCSAESLGRYGVEIDPLRYGSNPSYAFRSPIRSDSPWRFADLRAVVAAATFAADLVVARLHADRGANNPTLVSIAQEPSAWFLPLRDIAAWSIKAWNAVPVDTRANPRCSVCSQSVDQTDLESSPLLSKNDHDRF